MRIPTGIGSLDERIGGGLHPGTLTVVTLPQGAQYTPLVRAGLEIRSSLLLTTIKNKEITALSLERSSLETSGVTIRELNPGMAASMVPDQVRELDIDTDVYIDTIGPVEETIPTETYIDLLNNLSEKLHDIGSIGFLYCYNNRTDSYNNVVTLDIANFVLELEPVYSESQLRYRLRIPKSNGIKLSASDRSFELPLRQD